jgi:hypothetical protein
MAGKDEVTTDYVPEIEGWGPKAKIVYLIIFNNFTKDQSYHRMREVWKTPIVGLQEC